LSFFADLPQGNPAGQSYGNDAPRWLAVYSVSEGDISATVIGKAIV
jgi:hypothetical protein